MRHAWEYLWIRWTSLQPEQQLALAKNNDDQQGREHFFTGQDAEPTLYKWQRVAQPSQQSSNDNDEVHGH